MQISNHVIITWAVLIGLIGAAIWTGYHVNTPYTALATALVTLATASHVSNYLNQPADTAPNSNPTPTTSISVP